MDKTIDQLNTSAKLRVSLIDGNAINFSPKPRSRKRYGVTVRYYESGSEAVSKRIDYQIELSVEQFKNEHKTWQLCFDKVELYIDRHEPDLVSEQLASLAMGAIFPVKVDVNRDNEIFRGIVNHPDILSRWMKTKERISDKFEGDITELYLKKMDQKLADRVELEYALRLDMFWSVFFHPQYFKYGSGLDREMRFSFPAVAYRNLVFEGRQWIDPVYTDYGTYHVGFRSTEMLTEDLRFQMHSKAANEMRLEAQWDLDQAGGLLKHATVNWSLLNGRESEKRIFFSAYEIEARQEPVNGQLLQEKDEEMFGEVKKKGFWARLMS
ncbi:hypothetical protein [Pedobacter sp. BMA]|uniref:hypothetical protein n=1 Tax=Pedobacter sp. BMA TaxID=1663685 RepID=UPI0006497800|nr:hypothetical protein [Pedobacter sp. BMA]KLT67167.1 hypothetical protein AB669_00030 [Pedobacter sp. BMA]